MAKNVIMPKSGMAMEEGTIVRWLKAVGDTVSKGEAIAVIETDKVTMDLESDFDGTLLAIVHWDGEVVKATETIAWVGAPGEKVAATAAVPAAPAPAPAPAPHEPAPAPVAPAAAPSEAPGMAMRSAAAVTGGRIPATPAARAQAARSHIDLAAVAGSGPGGAVRLRDLPTPAATPAFTGMRRAIAEKMTRSHQQVPAVTLVTRADVTELAALRERVNAAGGDKLSYTDFIVKAAAAALREHPLVNSLVEANQVTMRDEVNVGIAVALEAGLIVPVIRGADRMSLRQIAAASRGLAERAREGTLSPQECSGGTFTVTNLGMYGITEFTPIINVPESAILGVGAIEDHLRLGAAGIESRKLMSLCLTHDHRHIDGAPAAAFLAKIRSLLENCYLLVA
jgi:pyruvate dehydrogenase E2 component (dihydrolipoamide acetyltransferase)